MATKPDGTALAVGSATITAEPATASKGSSEPDASIRPQCTNKLLCVQ